MGAKKKNKNGDGGNNDDNPTTVVLKVDMHCDGCASKITRCVRGIQGVETVKAESDANKLTIIGKLDPSKLRDKLAEKTKKKVELISPQPKKDSKDSKADNKKSDDKSEKKADEKKAKEKEPPVTTAILKVPLHCQGCIDRIRRTVSKTKGVHELSVDKEKDMVTVKGTMDVRALAENLTEKLKRKVEVAPPTKDKEKEKDKEGGGEKDGGNGGGKKKKGGGGVVEGDNDKTEDGGGGRGAKLDQSNREVFLPANGYGYGYGYNYNYAPVYMEPVHAPQMFSDENPNACSIM